MKKLLKVSELVKTILNDKPETRDDDNLLWLETVRETVRDRDNDGMPYMVDLHFAYVLMNIHRLGLPTFESVSRARRKLQEKYPELRGSENARRSRAKKEKTYKEYARL